jgi:hypothetical protein
MDNNIYGSSEKMPLLPIFQRRVIELSFDPSRVTVTVDWTNSYWLVWPCKFLTLFIFSVYVKRIVGRVSSVGMATGYGLDGLGIEFRWGGRDFPHRPDRPWSSPIPFEQWVPALFPGVKGPGRYVNQPSPSSADVKEGAGLYLCSPSGPSWLVLGWTLCEMY